jgi:DNA primase
MCLYEYGIPAIAPNSENLFITDKQYQKLKQKYRKIFLFYDNDLPGITNANKIRKQYPDLKVIFIRRKYDAEDISDFR